MGMKIINIIILYDIFILLIYITIKLIEKFI